MTEHVADTFNKNDDVESKEVVEHEPVAMSDFDFTELHRARMAVWEKEKEVETAHREYAETSKRLHDVYEKRQEEVSLLQKEADLIEMLIKDSLGLGTGVFSSNLTALGGHGSKLNTNGRLPEGRRRAMRLAISMRVKNWPAPSIARAIPAQHTSTRSALDLLPTDKRLASAATRVRPVYSTPAQDFTA